MKHLISREDYQGNIPRAIDEIIHVDGLDIIDLGAGTGRLTLILAPRAKSIRAFDVSAEMLRVCRERLIASGLIQLAGRCSGPSSTCQSKIIRLTWSSLAGV